MTKLIILRGNSGSGKTTIARLLQQEFGEGTLLVSQDVVRREMLRVKDTDHNLSIDLIKKIAMYGKNRCPYAIVEGILATSRYRSMLLDLIEYFDGKAFVYYFDLPFAETLARHQKRANRHEFGESELRQWWLEKDLLDNGYNLNEQIITRKDSKETIVKKITADLTSE